MPRYMVMVKATKDSETGAMPSRELIQAMGDFNQRLLDAGLLQSGDGLQPSSKGARVKFSRDGRKTLVDGPFPEAKELIAGYWIWKCKSREEAMQWAMECPAPFERQDCEIEIRQVFEPEDFAGQMSGDEIAAERRLFEKAAANK
jgi:hypothetical protein